jgi:hypothetical protein
MTYKEGDQLTVWEVKHTRTDCQIVQVTGKVGLVDAQLQRLEVHVPRRRRQLFVSLSADRPKHHCANAFLSFGGAKQEALRLLACSEHNLKDDLRQIAEARKIIENLKGPA